MPSNPTPTRAKGAATWRRTRPTTEAASPYGVLASAVFHALVFAAALFSFQRNFETPQETHMVPVDLVTIADTTNVQAQAPEAKPEPEKMDLPVLPPEPPPEPQMQAVEPAPDVPMPKFEVAKEQPKPVEKPVEKPKKTAADDFNSLLNKLTAPEKPVKNVKPGPRVIQGAGLGTAMTADIADALRSQIRRCWSLQIFPPNPADAIVDYHLRLNRDGTVASAELLSLNGNSFTRAAAEAASRAIYSCQPYRLPPDRYNVWSEISPLRFDPRQMMEP